MRQIGLALWLFVTVFGLGGCVCDRVQSQRDFDKLFKALGKYGDIEERAEEFKAYYPMLVARLDAESHDKVAGICGEHGHWYAATRLEPFLEEVNGEKRLLLAGLIGVWSHGYCREATVVAMAPPVGIGSRTKEINLVHRRFITDFRSARGTDELSEALSTRISLLKWHVMSDDERWQAIRKRVAWGLENPEEARREYEQKVDDYDAAVAELSVDTWWETICRLPDGDWSAAVKLAPYMSKTTGDRRILVALLVGVLSFGNNEEALQILSSATTEGSPEVKALTTSMVKVLGDIRQTYDPGHLLECYGMPYIAHDWDKMTPSQRWEAIRKYVGGLGKE